MLHHNSEPLDRAFHALSDPGRRAMIDRLTRGPVSVSDLAKPMSMTLSGVVQHLKILEQAGLVKSEKVGRVRTCTLEVEAMTRLEHWIAARKRIWEAQYDNLATYLADTATEEIDP